MTTPNFLLVLNSLVLFCVTRLAKEIFAISATIEKRDFFCWRILYGYRVKHLISTGYSDGPTHPRLILSSKKGPVCFILTVMTPGISRAQKTQAEHFL